MKRAQPKEQAAQSKAPPSKGRVMNKPEAARKNSRSLAKGIAAGLIAGLAGAIAMTFAERAFPRRTESDPEPPEFVPTREPAATPGLALVPVSDRPAPETIHWGLGALAGAAYGALAEFVPAATAKEGASFGMTVGALTQQGALSALGVAVRERNGTAQPIAELASFAVYGVTTEWVRRLLRKFI